jgi:hypothetical protein
MTMDAPHALRLTLMCLGFAVLHHDLHVLARIREFGAKGVFAVEHVMTARPQHARMLRGLGTLTAARGMTLSTSLSIAAALALVAGVGGPSAATVALVVVALTSWLEHFRRPYPDFASMSVTHLVSIALLVGMTAGAIDVALCFIAANTGLMYLAAGLPKIGRDWWTGKYLVQSLDLSGSLAKNELLLRLLDRHRWIARLLSRSLVFWEVSFCLAVLVRPEIALAYLGLGVLFHCGLAFALAHSTYVLPYLATYPAVWFAVQRLHG